MDITREILKHYRKPRGCKACIYAMVARESNRVKFGWSSDLAKRFKSNENASGFALSLVYVKWFLTEAAAQEAEKILLHVLDEHRCPRGEWFYWNEDVRGYIDHIDGKPKNGIDVSATCVSATHSCRDCSTPFHAYLIPCESEDNYWYPVMYCPACRRSQNTNAVAVCAAAITLRTWARGHDPEPRWLREYSWALNHYDDSEPRAY